MTKTHAMNVQMVRIYVRLIQTTNLASMQATQTCTMMELPIKQYKTHTTTKLHGEANPTILLARSNSSSQDHK